MILCNMIYIYYIMLGRHAESCAQIRYFTGLLRTTGKRQSWMSVMDVVAINAFRKILNISHFSFVFGTPCMRKFRNVFISRIDCENSNSVQLIIRTVYYNSLG